MPELFIRQSTPLLPTISFTLKAKLFSEAEAMIQFSAACGALVCTGTGGIDPQPTYQDVLDCLSGICGGDK